jgi:hypothetical protein
MSYFPDNYHEDFVTQKEIHQLSREKGWWESWPDAFQRFPLTVALMHSELSEALEDYRNGHGANEIYYEEKPEGRKPCGIPIELADLVIRCRDTAESLKIDLEAAIRIKHEFNKKRPYQHGGKRA